MIIENTIDKSSTNYALTKQIDKLNNFSINTSCGEIELIDSEVEKLKIFLTFLLEQRKKGEKENAI